MDKTWIVYLSGEIHTDWRDRLIDGARRHDLPVSFTSAVTNHAASDAAGDVLGKPETSFWRDHQSARVNGIRTRTLIGEADVVVVRFGQEYKQWNAAFDAGYAAAMGTPYITLHDEDIDHPLKEVDGDAMATARTPEDVIAVLRYVTGDPSIPWVKGE